MARIRLPLKSPFSLVMAASAREPARLSNVRIERSLTRKICSGLPQGHLEQHFVEMGEKPFHARQFMRWIYQRGVLDFADMTDLSKVVAPKPCHETATLDLPQVLSQHDSKDGTVKWLFASGSGQAVEAVFIPETERGTLCISSQVGCALDCAFCATGAQGFNRNLTAAEIVGQVWHANQTLPRRSNGEFAVTNVVFMGMGEPLANYRNLVPAIRSCCCPISPTACRDAKLRLAPPASCRTSKSLATNAMSHWPCPCMRPTMHCAINWCRSTRFIPIAELAGCLLALYREARQSLHHLRIRDAARCKRFAAAGGRAGRAAGRQAGES